MKKKSVINLIVYSWLIVGSESSDGNFFNRTSGMIENQAGLILFYWEVEWDEDIKNFIINFSVCSIIIVSLSM